MYFKNITALFYSTLKICKEDRGANFRNRMSANFKFYKLIAYIAIFCGGIYMYYPVKSYFIDGELVPFLPIKIMFIDQTNKLGFFIANAIMATAGVYAIFATVHMGMSFVAVIMNYGPRVDILKDNFNELDELWRDTSTSTLQYRHMFLRNICRKYVDMRE